MHKEAEKKWPAQSEQPIDGFDNNIVNIMSHLTKKHRSALCLRLPAVFAARLHLGISVLVSFCVVAFAVKCQVELRCFLVFSRSCVCFFFVFVDFKPEQEGDREM
jgi:hypothetical protein